MLFWVVNTNILLIKKNIFIMNKYIKFEFIEDKLLLFDIIDNNFVIYNDNFEVQTNNFKCS